MHYACMLFKHSSPSSSCYYFTVVLRDRKCGCVSCLGCFESSSEISSKLKRVNEHQHQYQHTLNTISPLNLTSTRVYEQTNRTKNLETNAHARETAVTAAQKTTGFNRASFVVTSFSQLLYFVGEYLIPCPCGMRHINIALFFT